MLIAVCHSCKQLLAKSGNEAVVIKAAEKHLDSNDDHEIIIGDGDEITEEQLLDLTPAELEENKAFH